MARVKKGGKNKQKQAQPVKLPPFGLAEEVLGKIPSREPSPATDAPKPKTEEQKKAIDSSMKYVSFALEREEYALPISQIQEINRVIDITRVPNSPDHILGVINLRGRIIPVLDLKHRLRIGDTNIGKSSRIVVVENGPKLLGLLVDGVSQVLDILSSQIEAAPEEVVPIDGNYIKGVGKLDNRMIIILELEKIIGEVNAPNESVS
jgi:purine-binding chemotaxis protein CheW